MFIEGYPIKKPEVLLNQATGTCKCYTMPAHLCFRKGRYSCCFYIWVYQLQLWPEMPVLSTYNPIYEMYNPSYNQLYYIFLINGHNCENLIRIFGAWMLGECVNVAQSDNFIGQQAMNRQYDSKFDLFWNSCARDPISQSWQKPSGWGQQQSNSSMNSLKSAERHEKRITCVQYVGCWRWTCMVCCRHPSAATKTGTSSQEGWTAYSCHLPQQDIWTWRWL